MTYIDEIKERIQDTQRYINSKMYDENGNYIGEKDATMQLIKGNDYHVFVRGDCDFVKATFKYESNTYSIPMCVFTIIEGKHKGIDIIVNKGSVKQ